MKFNYKNRKEKTKNLFKVVLSMLIIILFSSVVFAQTHTANQIKGGNFSSKDYEFPLNLIVNQTLTIRNGDLDLNNNALSNVDWSSTTTTSLDADTVDTLEASQFLRSDAADTLNIGRGDVYIESNTYDFQDGAGITLRTSINPVIGSIFSVRSSGQANRLWVGQSFTSSGYNDFYVGSSSSSDANDTSLYSVKLARSGDSYINGGNLGIGDTTPSYTLDVAGTGRFTGALTSSTIDTGSGAMELGDAAVANGDTNSIPTGDQVYDFVMGQGFGTGSGDITDVITTLGSCGSGDCDLRTIDGSGSGLDADTLDGVQASSFYQGSVSSFADGDTLPACAAGSHLYNNGGALACSSTDDDVPESGDFGAAADLDASGQVADDSHNHIYSNIDPTTSANWAGLVSDETGTGNMVFSSSPTLTTPRTAELRAASSAGLKLYEDGGTTGIFINDSGAVGIGTNSPVQKLDISGTIRAFGAELNSGIVSIALPGISAYSNHGLHYYAAPSFTGTEVAGIGVRSYEGGAQSIYITHGNDPWNSTTGIQIKNNGNVGIGTNSPSSKLEVSGTGGWEQGLTINNSHNNFRMYFSDDVNNTGFYMAYGGTGVGEIFMKDGNVSLALFGGKVGIGTTNPTATLDVEGNIHADAGIHVDRAKTGTDTNGLYLWGGDGTSAMDDLIYLDIESERLRVVGFLNGGTAQTWASVGGTSGWQAGSSRTYKQNITFLTEANYSNIRGIFENTTLYSYRRIDNPERLEVGYIAEESPDLIVGDDNKSVNYLKTIGFMSALIKDQQNQINELRQLVCFDHPEAEICS